MALGDFAGAGRPEQAAHLDVVHPSGETARIKLSDSPTIVGRVPGCSICLDHPMVSRQHARFEYADGHWRIVDLKSHNGTRVNKNPTRDHMLGDGDHVEIGPFTLTFHCRPTKLPPKPWQPPPIPTLNDQTIAIRTLHEIEPPHIKVEHLKGLEELTRALMDTKDPSERLTTLCRFMVQSRFGGRWAVAVSMNDATAAGEALCPVQFAGTQREQAKPYLSRSLLQAAYRRREPMLASNAPTSGDRGIELSIAPEVMMITAIAIPLQSPTTGSSDGSTVASGRVDLMYAVFPPEYGTGEWLALSNLAVDQYRQAETIWANIKRTTELEILKREIDRARQVQNRLVPRAPSMPGLGVAVRFKPCLAVGGDYVDVLPLPDGSALLVVADVCGKGLHAAMVAMGIHTIVHSAARRWAGLDDLAISASAHLIESLPADSFVTFLAITIDPITGALAAINGGHPPALIVGPTGNVRQFGENGVGPLGYAPEPPTVERGQLGDGETLVLFTDGCFEVEGDTGEMLGLADFYNWAAGHIGSIEGDVSFAADGLTIALDKWQGDGVPPDDRTMLLVRRETAEQLVDAT